MELSRRDMLKLGVLGTAALYLPAERFASALTTDRLAKLPPPSTRPYAPPPLIDLRAAANHGVPRTALQLTMKPVKAQILGPAPAWPATELWAYVGPNGEVNPTLRVDKGAPLALTQVNRLPPRHPQLGYESLTSVHLHGSPSLPQYDGYANDTIAPNYKKTYQYSNDESG